MYIDNNRKSMHFQRNTQMLEKDFQAVDSEDWMVVRASKSFSYNTGYMQ